ncbi:Flp family type IVb pilin [Massilia sp. CCM 8733]|uniref:Flp family type IVb pilin n=1 Tax=Massilia mucilaginosa TaxID=2609282 RepID=A0ABX0P006_9BURK|nr:Flp family type IVb pilin [Massilia mucilaginosa]NHZ92311.1 Flp family type IVb pilin [Massilia mucilaginosa]
MSTIPTAVQAFINDEDGATAIEYGLIAALIAVGLVTALTSVKSQLVVLFQQVVAGLTVP